MTIILAVAISQSLTSSSESSPTKVSSKHSLHIQIQAAGQTRRTGQRGKRTEHCSTAEGVKHYGAAKGLLAVVDVPLSHVVKGQFQAIEQS